MAEVEWARLKAQELRALADQNAVVILPVASIEQHGPHLPVMTDSAIGHEIALRAAREVSQTRPCVVAPVQWAGLSEHHMAFGGTLTLRQDTYRAVLRDLIDAILRHGFRDILISNSHGGNDIATKALLDDIAPDCPGTLVYACYVPEAGAEMSGPLEDQQNVMHAGEAETSMMMAIAPELVDDGDLAALNVPLGNAPIFLQAGQAAYRWRPLAHATPNGVLGSPEKASADKGTQLLEIGAAAIARLILDPATWAAPEDQRPETLGGVPLRRGT